MINDKTKYYIFFKDNLVFLSVAFLFCLCMIFISYSNDDAVYRSLGLSECISTVAVQGYYTWSSRLLINGVWMMILHGGRIVFGLYMGLSIFALLKAIEALFVRKPSNEFDLFVAVIVMLYPWQILSTAGWVATATSYFGPVAFGIAALIPIRRIYDGDSISLPAFAGYCICLIYGANLEQMMAVLLAAYIVALIWFTANKRLDLQIIILTCLSIVSAIYTLTCPGNSARSYSEVNNWFPTYPMFDSVDKMDLGITTTLHWMFFENNLLIIFICVMLAFLVWERYDNYFFRAISAIPATICVLVGPLQTVAASFFPYLAALANPAHTNGSFTVEKQGLGLGAMQFAAMLFICICVLLSLILLNDTVQSFLVCCVLVCAGVGSRIVMGFSPTIYASNTRTYSVLLICMIMLIVHLVTHNLSYLRQNGSVRASHSLISHFLVLFLLLGFANLLMTTLAVGR